MTHKAEHSAPFAHLSREELEHRLRVAEDVCVMFGWSGVHGIGDRGKAAVQLWMRWAELVGSDYIGPAAHPELAASEHSLARQRDATRAATLRQLHGGLPGATPN